MNNYIYEYYQQIVDGSVSVGKWVRLSYEMITRGLEDKSFFYAPKKAEKAIRFIENFCHHHEGALAPNLVKLELWQKSLIACIFGIVDEDGSRTFRECVVQIGRKNGKTLLAAGIAEFCMFLDGEYGGRIYFAAPKLQQANLCYDACVQMIRKEPELNSLAKKRRTDIYIEATNTSAQPLAFSAKKSDGLNISLCIADEISSWQGDAGIKFYEVIKSSFGARKQPLLLSISTAGYVNEGIFDELIKRCTSVLLGTSKERRLLPMLYTIDDIEKWNDINELRKSNPNLGVSISVDYLLEEIAVAEGSLSKKAEFLTKYCNIKQNSSQAFLSSAAVQRAIGEELRLEDFSHSYCVVGIDLSQTTDLTSACSVIERNGELYIISHFWLPSAKLEQATAKDGVPYRQFVDKGWLSLSGEGFVDYHDVFNWIRRLVEEYEILPLCIGYDRYSAQYLITDLNQYGFKTDDVFQGFNLTPAIQELEGSINSGIVHIGNNDLLKMHLLDTAVAVDAESRKKKIIKISQYAHIDGMAAILCALIVKQKWSDEIGAQLRNE